MKYDDAFYRGIRDDPWSALGVFLGGYDSTVDDNVLAVLRLVGDFASGTIAAKTGLTEPHVQLIQYILCSAKWADYGTSPSHCFIENGIEKGRLIKAFEDYYQRQWGEPPPS